MVLWFCDGSVGLYKLIEIVDLSFKVFCDEYLGVVADVVAWF